MFFLGACFLTASLMLPHARAEPVVAGMALAGLIQWAWSRFTGP
jgi:hypothetical protein